MALRDDLLLRQIHDFVRALAEAVSGRRVEVDEVRAEVEGRVGLRPEAAARLGAPVVLSMLTTAEGLDHGRAVLLGLGVAVEADVEADPARAAQLREVARGILDVGLPGLDAEQRQNATALARALGVSLTGP